VDSNGKYHNEYYRYKLTNASFILIVKYHENNFYGPKQELVVYLYGIQIDFVKKLVNVLKKLNKIFNF